MLPKAKTVYFHVDVNSAFLSWTAIQHLANGETLDLRTPSVMSAAMLQASPVGTFITCFVARVLVGLCAGWVYIGIKKLLPKNTKLCCAVGAVATPLLNTFWFMLSLCVFFFNTEYVQSLCATFGTTNPFLFVCAFVGVQALIEAVGCGIVATLVTVPLLKFLKK